ncbi:MAG: glycosyltransferase [Anaerolineales bacterium]|nr:glycosyltransferase [Anaerolineales bacterium]
MRAEHEIVLASFATESVSASSLAAMQTICDEVHVIPYRGFRADSRKARLGLFSPTPRSVIDTFSQEMFDIVSAVAATWQPELVIASQIDMARYALAVENTHRVLEELELAVPYDAYQNERHLLTRLRKGLTWWKLERYLRRTLSAFDLCTVVSVGERELVSKVCPATLPVHIVPNGADLQRMDEVHVEPEPDTLIYSGALSFYANFDAMRYFLGEIFPLILEQAPATRLLITGSIQDVAIDQLPQCQNVYFTGYLDDVWSAVAGSWASVVPLRLGGGTRLKVIESLALGTPVISTHKGVEGLSLTPNEDILLADDPHKFAEQTLLVLQNTEARQRFSQAGRRAVRHYDWSLIGQQLNCLLAETISQDRRFPHRTF